MRIGVGRIGTRLAVAALCCLPSAGLPALASALSVSLADGTLITVREQRGRALPGRGQEMWVIGYSVTDAAGTRLGVVPPTGDTNRDSAPFLALDDSGSAVVVWSRFDGSYRKIAYARFAGGAWTDFHYLTFGPGDDDLPRIGTANAGAFLFFVGGPGEYRYAPLDLLSGRLFAAPRTLDLGIARRDVLPPSGKVTTQGASVDIPVVNRCPGERGACGSQAIRYRGLLPPGGATTQGGTVDIPVVNDHVQASVWGVGSGSDCNSLVLVIPTYDLKHAYVSRFFNGMLHILVRVSLPPQVEDRFGEGLAAAYLPLVCH